MSKCISSHGEYSEHEPGDPCPWCGEYDTERIISERDQAEARIKAVRDACDDYSLTDIWGDKERIATADIRRALDG